MPAVKKTPERKCVACNQMKPKNTLIRVVKNSKNEIFIDKTGKADGRGAYICNNVICFAKAKKTRRFDKTFSMSVPDEVYSRLEEAVKE